LSPNPTYPDILAPSPDLLTLHASVAKVLQISGRGEKLEQIWRDKDELKVLATDGSSHSLLFTLLFEVALERGEKEYEVDDDIVELNLQGDRSACRGLTDRHAE